MALNKTGEGFIDATPRQNKTVCLLLSRSALRHQQRLCFHHAAICADARRISVAIAASIVAIGISANLWRFLWGPIADLTLTAHRCAYAFFGGAAYAAFSAVVLFAIGRGAASTKYAALSSLGNVPVVYMTALDGWVHDRFGTGWMLQTDALSAIVFVVVALFILHKINAARAQDLAEDKSRVG